MKPVATAAVVRVAVAVAVAARRAESWTGGWTWGSAGGEGRIRGGRAERWTSDREDKAGAGCWAAVGRGTRGPIDGAGRRKGKRVAKTDSLTDDPRRAKTVTHRHTQAHTQTLSDVPWPNGDACALVGCRWRAPATQPVTPHHMLRPAGGRGEEDVRDAPRATRDSARVIRDAVSITLTCV